VNTHVKQPPPPICRRLKKLGNLQGFLNLRVLFPPNVPKKGKKYKTKPFKKKNTHNKTNGILTKAVQKIKS